MEGASTLRQSGDELHLRARVACQSGIARAPRRRVGVSPADFRAQGTDPLVGTMEEAMERWQKYSTALVTAAFTGKIDVRTNAGTITP